MNKSKAVLFTCTLLSALVLNSAIETSVHNPKGRKIELESLMDDISRTKSGEDKNQYIDSNLSKYKADIARTISDNQTKRTLGWYLKRYYKRRSRCSCKENQKSHDRKRKKHERSFPHKGRIYFLDDDNHWRPRSKGKKRCSHKHHEPTSHKPSHKGGKGGKGGKGEPKPPAPTAKGSSKGSDGDRPRPPTSPSTTKGGKGGPKPPAPTAKGSSKGSEGDRPRPPTSPSTTKGGPKIPAPTAKGSSKGYNESKKERSKKLYKGSSQKHDNSRKNSKKSGRNSAKSKKKSKSSKRKSSKFSVVFDDDWY